MEPNHTASASQPVIDTSTSSVDVEIPKLEISKLETLKPETVKPEIAQALKDAENIKNIVLESLDGAYKGDEVKQEVMKILGLKNVIGWDVLDYNEEEKLALVHYNGQADMTVHRPLRGVLVDLEVGCVIADSFGYTPTAVQPFIEEINGHIIISDMEDNIHSFPVNKTRIVRCFEGVVMRVIWHKGRMLCITHRKINPERSHWGNSKSFLQLFNEAGAPSAEDLFDTSKPFSNICFDFLVCDQSLLVGTRQMVNKPYLIFLSRRPLKINRPAEEIGKPMGKLYDGPKEQKPVGTIMVSPQISGTVDRSFIHQLSTFTIEEANYFLRYGYYQPFDPLDIRQFSGEAILMYHEVNGKIADIVKVHSPAFEWRCFMRGNNPNIMHQFHTLLRFSLPELDTEENRQTLFRNIVPYPPYAESQLREIYEREGVILSVPVDGFDLRAYKTREERTHLLWINFVVSLPAHLQLEALGLEKKFTQQREDLLEWLFSLHETTSDIENSEFHARIKGIISEARRMGQSKFKTADAEQRRKKHFTVPFAIKSTIRNFLNKENGTSLYSLCREMKRAKEAKEREEKEAAEKKVASDNVVEEKKEEAVSS